MIQHLTQDRLKEVFRYDPISGIFTRLIATSNNVKVGDVAGTPNELGYLLICIDGHRYRAHRLAWLYMTGRWPVDEIDHVESNPRDNRFAKLREATHAQNMANCRKPSTNRSGLKGVSWDAINQRWRASISVRGKSINLGRFSTKRLAHTAYLKAAQNAFAEFARAA